MANRSFGVDLMAQKGTNAADGTSPTDLVTKQQLDNAIAGLAWKQPVKVATTANGALASAYANGQSVDGATLVTGDRILVKDQTTGSENGIYTVNAAGAPTRTADADASAELQSATVYVVQGTANGDKAFTQTANSPTLGTTALTWSQVGGGTNYTAGAGLVLSGATFAVNPGPGVIADGTSTRLDPTYTGLAKRYSQDIGATSAGTTITITHNLGTQDVLIQIRRVSDNAIVDTNFLPATGNTVTGTFPVAVSAGEYRISILG